MSQKEIGPRKNRSQKKVGPRKKTGPRNFIDAVPVFEQHNGSTSKCVQVWLKEGKTWLI